MRDRADLRDSDADGGSTKSSSTPWHAPHIARLSSEHLPPDPRGADDEGNAAGAWDDEVAVPFGVAIDVDGPMRTRRLGPGDGTLARALFTMMGEVFDEEPWAPLGDEYLARLLARSDLWIVAAVEGGAPVGGLTAHALPMTRAEAVELLIYDLAVRADRQRRGIGTALVERLRADASTAGVDTVWVPADDEDLHALEFYRRAGGEPQAVTIFTWEG